MKIENAPERATTLVTRIIDVLRSTDDAPTSPVRSFLPPKQRRELRRSAVRLRKGQAEPRYKNLFTAAQLAGIFERAARRDELFEAAFEEFRRMTLELGRILLQKDPAVEEALDAFVDEMRQSANEQGPGSEAARRFLHLRMLGWIGRQQHSQKRRQRRRAPLRVPAAGPHLELAAIELLDSPPPSPETVLAIPQDRDYGQGRALIRVGIGQWSWTGSFARGHQHVSTSCLMPDNEHLFISADGAGYVIDARSRMLLEETGTDVTGVMLDEQRTLFVIIHDHRILEAFDRTGRLWITRPIAAGCLRAMAITDDALIGEARHPSRPGWVRFSVRLASGEVWLREGG